MSGQHAVAGIAREMTHSRDAGCCSWKKDEGLGLSQAACGAGTGILHLKIAGVQFSASLGSNLVACPKEAARARAWADGGEQEKERWALKDLQTDNHNPQPQPELDARLRHSHDQSLRLRHGQDNTETARKSGVTSTDLDLGTAKAAERLSGCQRGTARKAEA
ncbi:hypothetical protein MMC29_000580 [Sticta canariensis]|nr:hypothetical protein [Sticta canariensis]